MTNAREVLYGVAAGAEGTAVLNATTYADMAIRARPEGRRHGHGNGQDEPP